MTTLAMDIGGANVKAMHRDGRVWNEPFALWLEPEKLVDVLRKIVDESPAFDHFAVTMTAELCDCFATKREGVDRVLGAVEQVASSRHINVWMTTGVFASVDEAREQPLVCGAANWHALATHVATLYPDGLSLLIDTGSTTTDILRLRHGRLAVEGLTDMQRLTTGELVYTGAQRTALMNFGPRIGWRDKFVYLMAERFATTADVYVLLGDLPEQPQNMETPDFQPMTKQYAARRLVRMIGADLEMLNDSDAHDLALIFANRQYDLIATAARALLHPEPPQRIVVSGSGAFVAERAAMLAYPNVTIERLEDRIGAEASIAACAWALLQLSE